MTARLTILGTLRRCLAEDNPGEHVYQFVCDGCGRACGPEFVVNHLSTGRDSDPVPSVVPACACGGSMARTA